MNETQVLNEINNKEWDGFLRNNQFASPFQTKKYFSFLKANSQTDAFVFALFVDQSIKVLMLVTIMKESGIKGFFSKRGIIFGGPVLSDDLQDDELSFFLQEVEKRMRGKAIYLETRNFFDYSAFKNSFQKCGWNYEPYLNFQLPLNGVSKDKVLSLFKYNRRREIKQSLSQGATYRFCDNDNEIASIYAILKDLYLTRVKVPLPDIDFFMGLYRAGILKVFIVQHNGQTIGGSFCPVLSKKGIYTFYYCGIRDYHKRIFPAHLAVLAAMEYAIDNNIPMIDFMGAGKPDVDYGVRKYKSEFGGILVEHGRFIKILNPFLYNLGKIGLKVLAKIK